MILQAWEKNAGEQKNHDKWDSKKAILPPFYCHSSPLTNSQKSYHIAGPTEVQLRQPRQCLGTRTCHQKARSAQEIVLPLGVGRLDEVRFFHLQTWNLKISPWKSRFLLETIIFRFHVKLWGGGNMDTPPKTKMEPKKWIHNHQIWKELPFPNHYLWSESWKSPGVICKTKVNGLLCRNVFVDPLQDRRWFSSSDSPQTKMQTSWVAPQYNSAIDLQVLVRKFPD